MLYYDRDYNVEKMINSVGFLFCRIACSRALEMSESNNSGVVIAFYPTSVSFN